MRKGENHADLCRPGVKLKLLWWEYKELYSLSKIEESLGARKFCIGYVPKPMLAHNRVDSLLLATSDWFHVPSASVCSNLLNLFFHWKTGPRSCTEPLGLASPKRPSQAALSGKHSFLDIKGFNLLRPFVKTNRATVSGSPDRCGRWGTLHFAG